MGPLIPLDRGVLSLHRQYYCYFYITICPYFTLPNIIAQHHAELPRNIVECCPYTTQCIDRLCNKSACFFIFLNIVYCQHYTLNVQCRCACRNPLMLVRQIEDETRYFFPRLLVLFASMYASLRCRDFKMLFQLLKLMSS